MNKLRSMVVLVEEVTALLRAVHVDLNSALSRTLSHPH